MITLKTIGRKLLPDGEGPLYKQLADLILEEIKQGILEPNSNLPTVRDLAEEMSLSTGTVMHAYNELETLGVIEKIRGSGTFVRNQIDTQAGKKDRAMQIMDNLFRDMQELGFSVRETQIYFDLKLRGVEDTPNQANVLVVDCNPEALSIIANQISAVRGAQVSCRLLDDLSSVPGLLDTNPDVIVTTATHFDMVASLTREDLVTRVVLSPSRNTIASLAKVENNRIGMLTASDRFAQIVGNICNDFSSKFSQMPHMLFGDESVGDFIDSLDTIILPDHYSRLCSQADLLAIRAFEESGGSIIKFTYRIDAGSLMYLEQKIENVLTSR